jgi:hypothetical protein
MGAGWWAGKRKVCKEFKIKVLENKNYLQYGSNRIFLYIFEVTVINFIKSSRLKQKSPYYLDMNLLMAF